MITSASRCEHRDRQGDYRGTFVTDDRSWQIGHGFTTGDRRVLRIIGNAVPERSFERAAYAGGWIVEPLEGTP
jgi:hypothetical protein